MVWLAQLARPWPLRTAGYFDALAKFVFDEEGRRAKVKRAILDKNMKVSLGTEIGYNLEEDRKKYHVTDSGIVVVQGHHTHPSARANLRQ